MRGAFVNKKVREMGCDTFVNKKMREIRCDAFVNKKVWEIKPRSTAEHYSASPVGTIAIPLYTLSKQSVISATSIRTPSIFIYRE